MTRLGWLGELAVGLAVQHEALVDVHVAAEVCQGLGLLLRWRAHLLVGRLIAKLHESRQVVTSKRLGITLFALTRPNEGTALVVTLLMIIKQQFFGQVVRSNRHFYVAFNR